MEIQKVNLGKALQFKVPREKGTYKVAVLRYEAEPFDIIEWAKGKNTFGPNYLIKPDGTIYEVLPQEYQPDFGPTDKDALLVVIIESHNTDKALEKLKDYLSPQKPNKENEVDRPHIERSSIPKTSKKKKR